MSTEDTTAQLREQIADALFQVIEKAHGESAVAVKSLAQAREGADALMPIVLARVEAAEATARRDALLEAADEVKRIRADGGVGPYARHFEDWLRARASAQGAAAPVERSGWGDPWCVHLHGAGMQCYLCVVRDVTDFPTRDQAAQGAQSSGHEFKLAAGRAAGGVQPAPAATWTEAEIRTAFRGALFYSAPDTGGRLVFGYADPHVYLDTDPYLPKAEDALLIALRAAGSESTDQPPAETPGTVAPFGEVEERPGLLPADDAPRVTVPGPCTCDQVGGAHWQGCKLLDSAAGSTDGAGTPEAAEFIYPGGGLAFAELRPADGAGGPITTGEATSLDWDMSPGRWALIRDGEVAATAGPGSQDLGPDWVPVEQVTRNWNREPTVGELGLSDPPQLGPEDYPEDHGGRDPHCGIVHPHSKTSRCAGE